MRIGVYPGTFDPITLGHLDIIRRGAHLVDQLVIGVTTNPSKEPMFAVAERLAMVGARSPASPGNIDVVEFDSLLMDFAEAQGASMILRGLRAVADFEYEYQMAGMNQQLNDRYRDRLPDGRRVAAADRVEAGQGNRALWRQHRQVRHAGGRGRRRARTWQAAQIALAKFASAAIGEPLPEDLNSMSKALFALPFLALALIAAKPAPVAARAVGHDRAGRGRRRPGEPLDARAVDRRRGRRSSCAPTSRPAHVERIQTLARSGFYNGLIFHRVIPGFMAQGGDPRAPARAARSFPTSRPSSTHLPHLRGTVVDGARRGRRTAPTASSSSCSRRDSRSTITIPAFGRVIAGMDVVDAIAVGEPPASRPGSSGRASATPAAAAARRQPALRRRADRLPSRRSAPKRLRRAAAQAAGALMRVDLFRFRASRRPDRAAARRGRATARGCCWSRASRLSDRDGARPAAAAAARRRAGLQRHQGHPRPARRPARRGADRRDPAQARRPARLAGLRPQRQAAARRRHDRFRRGRRGVGGREGRRRRRSCCTSTARSRSSCCSSAPGGCRCRPISPSQRPADARRPRRLSDDVRARGRARSRRRPRRCISPPRLIEALDAAGIGRETLTLHVGAGTFLPVKAERHGRAQDARRMGPDRRRHRRAAQRRAARRRAADRGRHDLAAPARKRGRTRTARSGRSKATPRSSSRPAIASGRSTA